MKSAVIKWKQVFNITKQRIKVIRGKECKLRREQYGGMV